VRNHGFGAIFPGGEDVRALQDLLCCGEGGEELLLNCSSQDGLDELVVEVVPDLEVVGFVRCGDGDAILLKYSGIFLLKAKTKNVEVFSKKPLRKFRKIYNLLLKQFFTVFSENFQESLVN
jgi:hypothetical protein